MVYKLMVPVAFADNHVVYDIIYTDSTAGFNNFIILWGVKL